MGHWEYQEEFVQALRRSDASEVRRLITLGIDPNRAIAVDYNERPLGFAIRRDDVAMVETLLACGADPDRRDYEGYAPTQIAIQGRHYEPLQTLLEYGEAPARETRAVHALHTAIGRDDLSLVRRLLDAGADIDAPDPRGYTPLMLAIGDDAGLLNGEAWGEPSPTDLPLVRLLLDRGAKIDIALDAEFPQGLTALHCAALRGERQVVAWLQEKGAQITLSVAAILGDVDRTRLLLAGGESPEQSEVAGRAPLHLAAAWGHTEVMHLLLAHGADTLRKDSQGASPLYYAAVRGHAESVRLLLQHGAGAERECHVLSHAAAFGHREVVLLLLQAGWDIDGDPTDGLSPLMEAAIADSPDMVRLLIAQGANVNLANPFEFTALMCAAQHDCVAAGRALVEGGADLHVLHEHNMTAFAEALSSPDFDERR